ncbi:bifunctional riboflavin kinase/FAD synthetase [Galbitalea soli]|uniref:Riboflavin biosynthesis protein n=1 Tax=Galbitalea soli TaxID=1268042 RepID=A0A7C9PLY2_9MICO|nr:bifunctional riboflavin kinase/FAD synthetase [Galbitalea soli]NEM90407.1 bifunctional riboflavin kinase/FAD synthetase [Galbitalea soli]NYJ31118.1 riboflavin kinase/FMN adenylyltransferase [Galbitalea soli]
MRFFDGLAAVPAGFGPSAVTIGKFDGVHAGHRAVIADLARTARREGLASVIVTFDRNPLEVLAPEKCPEALISNRQKVELIGELGVDATLMLAFDRHFSEQPPERFVQDVLVSALGARIVFVGSDFRFGAKGAGTVDRLREWGDASGFRVETIDDVTVGGERRASSTWIRELLAAGDVAAASTLLGRLPTVRSVVVHGQKRGRELGYPTANLSPAIEGFIPADGVYAAWATIDGVRYAAAVSIGNNPTFDGVPQKQVEAHLLDVTLDLYDRDIEVSFVDFVRSMTKFDSLDALIAQMRDDVARVRALLGLTPAR